MSATGTTATQTLTGRYNIDPAHSRVGFSARHAMVTKVRGAFNEFEGSGYFDADDPSKIEVELTIKAASIDTRNADRDNHLRSNDFLAMDEYPELRFRSTKAERSGDSTYKLTGDLTIRGVTRSVVLDLELTGSAVDPWGNLRIGLEGGTRINRKDWGINWNAALEAGGLLVSETVDLELEIAAVKAND